MNTPSVALAFTLPLLLVVPSENIAEGFQEVYALAIGTVYVVSVRGPVMYRIDNYARASRAAEDPQLFQIIAVSPEELQFEARIAANQLYDGFTLRKRAGQPNELVELHDLPDERRMPPVTNPSAP